jgi:hypothetical protein
MALVAAGHSDCPGEAAGVKKQPVERPIDWLVPGAGGAVSVAWLIDAEIVCSLQKPAHRTGPSDAPT